MRYAIGYQLPDAHDSIVDIVRDYREHVAEVYFAWPGDASARSPVGIYDEAAGEELTHAIVDELAEVHRVGVGLVLLFNANCYGDISMSRQLERRVLTVLEQALEAFPLKAITTTSPFVASVVKRRCPSIELRASVNMRIGTVKGMEYLAEQFDGYYMQRDCNRDPPRIEQLRAWCDRHGKGLYMLANSGCLSYCSNQTYHDNLVAHEADIIRHDNVPSRYPSPCWDYLANPENRVAFLQGTWIRPEDIHRYDTYFDVAKLATRMHASPRKVVDAYARQRFRGNLLDLTEPGFGSLFPGAIIDNTLFPDHWFVRTTSCDKQCHACAYCSEVLRETLVSVG